MTQKLLKIASGFDVGIGRQQIKVLAKKLLEIVSEDLTKKLLEIASEDSTKKLLEIVSADPTKYCYVEIASEDSTKIQKCFKIAYEDSSEKLFLKLLLTIRLKNCLKLLLKIRPKSCFKIAS